MTSARPRLRSRHLQSVAAQPGELYAAVEALSLNMHRWQRQIGDVDNYIDNR